MTPGCPPAIGRRGVLRGLAALAAVAALPGVSGCGSPFADRRLTIAAGVQPGVYFQLASALAAVWQERLGLGAAPRVLDTAGSVDNLDRLADGSADVIFSQVDTAAERPEAADLRALARIYDDALHVVVRRESPWQRLGDLRGAKVSIGPATSGYHVAARRVLTAAGVDADRDLHTSTLGLPDSIAGLRDGGLDAFFWFGGVPTSGISELATATPIRLLDLTDVLESMRVSYPVYAAGTVPASAYDTGGPISTLFVRNLLLVRASIDDDLAAALVEAMLAEQSRLATTSPAALTIDSRSAIGTQPIPLHPGAERFYRAGKGA